MRFENFNSTDQAGQEQTWKHEAYLLFPVHLDGTLVDNAKSMKTKKEVFLKGPCLYAFKGLAGRFAPIGVHLAMLLIMGGATLSATGSFKGYVTVPQGLNFVVRDVMNPNGFLSNPTKAFNTEVHVSGFSMDYYDSGEDEIHLDLKHSKTGMIAMASAGEDLNASQFYITLREVSTTLMENILFSGRLLKVLIHWKGLQQSKPRPFW